MTTRMAMTPDETTEQTSVGSLKPQPHGGAIRHGGTNKGGPGRPPSEFRRVARKLLHNRNLLPRLADIAEAKIGEIKEIFVDGMVIKTYTETPIREQRGAIDTLLKIGVGDGKEKMMPVSMVGAKLQATLAVLTANLSPEIAEDMINRIGPIWRQ